MRQQLDPTVIPDDVAPIKYMRVEQQKLVQFGDIINQIALADTDEKRTALIKEGMARITVLNALAQMEAEPTAVEPLVLATEPEDPLANVFPPTKMTMGVTINLLNFENVKVEAEAPNIESCMFAVVHALTKLGSKHEPTKELINMYLRRVVE